MFKIVHEPDFLYEGDTFKLLFEDGPFWIHCSKDGEFITLRFQTDRHIADVIPEQKLYYLDFAREIARAARSLSSSLFLAGHEQDACAMNRIAQDIERRLV